jgi:hypothetical protein
VIWRLFRRTVAPDPWAHWWQQADQAARNPSAETIERLQQALAAAPAGEDVESQEEMVDGLRNLLALSAGDDLPVLESQHRVIGDDICHFIAPVTLPGPDLAPGKVFLTSRRFVLVAGRVRSRPWPAVGRLSRSGRRLTIGSGDSAVEIQCNSFGDALAAHHVASRLSAGGPRP